MPDLSNSQRRLFKATYAPIQPKDGRPSTTQRVLAKMAFLSSLGVRPAELDGLRRQLGQSLANPEIAAVLEAVRDVVDDGTPGAAYAQLPKLASISAEALLTVGRALAVERSATASTLQNMINELRSQYRVGGEPLSSPAATPAATRQIPTPTAGAEPTQLPKTSSIMKQDLKGHRVRVTTTHNTNRPNGLMVVRAERIVEPVLPITAGAVAMPAATQTPGSIEDAINWAAKYRPDSFEALKTLAEQRAPVPLAYSVVDTAVALSHVIPKIAAAASAALASIRVLQEHMKVEPVGRLHLERLDMTPVGVERGELISSIPLTPKETVNISHREWSVTSQEFESIVQDFFEGYSEEGVSEKSELAQSTENQSKHSNALNFGAAATASYLGVTLSSSVGYNATSSDDQALKDSRNQTITATRKASARTKKDHKTTFKVSSVAGMLDQAVRVITNPSDTESMRVDYYQLMRKWRVDLYRYGLRMTYDIVIPSPGSDLIRKIRNLATLDDQLSQPFDFELQVSHITRDNWQQQAALYQASVEAPPEQSIPLMASAKIQQTKDDNDTLFTGSIDINVDGNYDLDSGEVIAIYYYDQVAEDRLFFDVIFDNIAAVTSTLFPDYPSAPIQGAIVGRTGNLSIPFYHRGVVAGSISVIYTISLRDEVYQAWQFRAWSAIREGAQALYEARVQKLRDQRAAMVADLAPFDSLTLRTMELEEIMKGTLRWLFGPAFSLAPADIQQILGKMNINDPLSNDALDPSVLTNQQWQRMMEFGEFIKYVQQAIEWENVIYFTYPYFWDTPKNWTLKQFLEYPDALHRTFLRAGSARVVLTIRPGFEQSFASLIETGAFGKLPGDHPYVTIAQEIQDYANTNYPGIPPANPDGSPPSEDAVNQGEKGQLTATWWEYTPTSALDVALNTAFPNMA